MIPRARWIKGVRDGLLAVLGVAALGLAAFFALHQPKERPARLRITAGQTEGTRHRIAQELQREAAHRAITIELHATAGSEEALREVDAGRLDAALVQGGLDLSDRPALRQVVALHVEPLHLLVKEEIHVEVSHNLAALRSKVINLGKRGSGTYLLASDVMAFAGLQSGDDFVESTLGYADLQREADRTRMPDAVFTVSTLPSPVARYLVTAHRYRLVALPFFQAFTLDTLDRDPAPAGRPGEAVTGIERRHICDATIPSFTYEVEPSVPPEEIHTLGTRLLLVARKDVAAPTIQRLLEVIFYSPFAQVVQPPLDPKLLEVSPELAWHDGTTDYLRRNAPVIAGDMVDLVEKELSIIGALVGGLFFLGQWLRRRNRRRRDRSFETYILRILEIERRTMALERAAALDLAALLRLQEDLSGLKVEALERFASGELEGEQLVSGFLAHVSDARDYLTRLILHARDSLEDQAHLEGREAQDLWREAIGAARDSQVAT